MAKTEEKKHRTLGDYVTMAFSPVLIMTLVGSLVFFLTEVFYGGQYETRLLYTLFWFVMGMVLIARIQIENNDGRWKWYGIGLGGAVYVALHAFIEYPPDSVLVEFRWLINLVLMGVIWWATHRLTWDSTHIDDRVDASGMGVLEAAGLDEAAASPEGLAKPAEEQVDQPDDSAGTREPTSWWGRYRKYQSEQSKKPHTPGVWVVYFSMAALPLFGLGQVLIPVGDTARRQYVFWLFTVYMGSGLGLLLTTSYLGLRRYLRQRKLPMPRAMTSVWLSVGGTMVVILLILGAVLPRPFGEYQLVDFTRFGAPERKASEYALNRDSKAKGEGSASSDASQRDQDAKSTTSGQSGKQGQSKSSSSSSREKSQGQKSSNSNQRSDGEQHRKDSDRSKDDSRKDEEKKDKEDESKDQSNKSQREGPAKQQSGQGRTSKSASDRNAQEQSNRPMPNFLSKLGWLATVLKWVVFGAFALVVGFYLVRSGLHWLANFTNWAKNLLESLRSWWESLFGGRKKQPVLADGDADPEERILAPRPFALFPDPFLDGTAERTSPNQLVRYSFEALQSWAWERKLGREPADTPREFVERLVAELPALDREARGLAALYARVAYARSNLGPGALDPLRQFWQRLHEVSERPLSA
jgi:hypothetical protein